MHPDVNSFVNSSLATVRGLMLDNFAEKYVLVIKTDNRPIQKFVFLLHSYFKTTSR